jgi:O-acetyl-ADP-ribose deacetylase (regulator of RNase III)
MIVIINNKQEPLDFFKDMNTLCCNIEEIFTKIHQKPVYFVSPANSLLFMDGGIDFAYCKMFKGIQQYVQENMRNNPCTPTSLLGRKYLPVGSAILNKISNDCYLISAPTMLLPQNISQTNNAYYSMKAILKVWPGNGILIVPLLGGGIGRIAPENVYEQMKKAMDEYGAYAGSEFIGPFYIPQNVDQIMNEQPKVYENSEFIKLDISQIKNSNVNV